MKTLMILCTAPDERLEMAIKEAASLEYRTIFCGEKMHEPTKNAVDAFYVVDYADSAELIRIAQKEKIDGVVGLCDSAMIPAAKIAEALHLPGNPPETMEKLISKIEFRKLQREAGIFCPKNIVISSPEEFLKQENSMSFPVIIKPELASSSHGMTVLENSAHFEEAFREAAAVSRNGKCCVEEYVQNNSLRIIETDIFLYEDDFFWDGMRYCYRLDIAPLRPAYDVYSVSLSEKELAEFRNSVASVLKHAGAKIGEYNLEGFFTKEGRFFIIEINPRQAGHYNPQDIQLYCGVNLTKLLITTAVGETGYYKEVKNQKRTYRHILSYSVFSEKNGILDSIHIDESIKPKIREFRYLMGQKEGDSIQNIIDAVRPIAQIAFEFDSAEELESTRKRISELVYAVVK